MWPRGHFFLCCGLLTFLFVLCVMGTELMEQGACSRQMAFVGLFLNFTWAEFWSQLHRYKPGEILLLLWSHSRFTPVKAAAETSSEMLSGTFQLPTPAVCCCVLSFTVNIMSPRRAKASPSCLTQKGSQTAGQLWVTSHGARGAPLLCREHWAGWASSAGKVQGGGPGSGRVVAACDG